MACNKVNQESTLADQALTAELNIYTEKDHLLENQDNLNGKHQDTSNSFSDLENKINLLKQSLSKESKEKESLLKTVNVLKSESMELESKSLETEIALSNKIKHLDNVVFKMGQSAQTVHMLTNPQPFYDPHTKQALGFQNPAFLKKAQLISPELYNGNIMIKDHPVFKKSNYEETLLLAEESHSKMLLKINEPEAIEKKNSFENSEELSTSTSDKTEVPKELPKIKKRNVWKPTGKMFNSVGYQWRPTGQTLTIVENKCPLTRFTSINVVPPKETTPIKVVVPKPTVKLVYTRRSNEIKSDFNVKFKNDQIAKIMGYGDLVVSNVTISKVNYVEGLGHNLFSVSQFCDVHLEVAFQKHTCYVHNLESVYLLSGSRDTNLYTLSFEDMTTSTPICLLSKATKTKSWLWHRRLSHLNFEAVNYLARHGLVRGLTKLKYHKDHLCPTCAMGKSISHETSVALTPQQNGIIERRSRTLVEAARTMLIFEQAILSLWAETVATTCYNQNRSLLRRHHDKTPYELLHDKKPDILRPALHEMTPDTPSKGLDPIPPLSAPFVPPSRDAWDLLFQPVFDELLNPPTNVVSLTYVVIASAVVDPVNGDSTDTPSLITID
nr:integrase, catalytic region, zinc finger, CCHC-type, peptidase aspartic, catalytic [Tanacetum cinerariifolium]